MGCVCVAYLRVATTESAGATCCCWLLRAWLRVCQLGLLHVRPSRGRGAHIRHDRCRTYMCAVSSLLACACLGIVCAVRVPRRTRHGDHVHTSIISLIGETVRASRHTAHTGADTVFCGAH